MCVLMFYAYDLFFEVAKKYYNSISMNEYDFAYEIVIPFLVNNALYE